MIAHAIAQTYGVAMTTSTCAKDGIATHSALHSISMRLCRGSPHTFKVECFTVADERFDPRRNISG